MADGDALGAAVQAVQDGLNDLQRRFGQMGIRQVLGGTGIAGAAGTEIPHFGVFHGKPGEDINVWIEKMEVFCNAYEIDEAERLRKLPAYLEGRARQTYIGFNQYARTHYGDNPAIAAPNTGLITNLKNAFDDADHRRFCANKLRVRKQNDFEGVYDFAQDISALVKGAFEHTRGAGNANAFSDIAREFFVRGINPGYKDKVDDNRNIGTFQQAVDYVAGLENSNFLKEQQRKDAEREKGVEFYKMEEELRRAHRLLELERRENAAARLSDQNRGRNQNRESVKRNNRQRGNNGDRHLHNIDRNRQTPSAPSRPSILAANNSSSGRENGSDGQTCWRCGQDGHFRRSCPNGYGPRADSGSVGRNRGNSGQSHSSRDARGRQSPYLRRQPSAGSEAGSRPGSADRFQRRSENRSISAIFGTKSANSRGSSSLAESSSVNVTDWSNDSVGSDPKNCRKEIIGDVSQIDPLFVDQVFSQDFIGMNSAIVKALLALETLKCAVAATKSKPVVAGLINQDETAVFEHNVCSAGDFENSEVFGQLLRLRAEPKKGLDCQADFSDSRTTFAAGSGTAAADGILAGGYSVVTETVSGANVAPTGPEDHAGEPSPQFLPQAKASISASPDNVSGFENASNELSLEAVLENRAVSVSSPDFWLSSQFPFAECNDATFRRTVVKNDRDWYAFFNEPEWRWEEESRNEWGNAYKNRPIWLHQFMGRVFDPRDFPADPWYLDVDAVMELQVLEMEADNRYASRQVSRRQFSDEEQQAIEWFASAVGSGLGDEEFLSAFERDRWNLERIYHSPFGVVYVPMVRLLIVEQSYGAFEDSPSISRAETSASRFSEFTVGSDSTEVFAPSAHFGNDAVPQGNVWQQILEQLRNRIVEYDDLGMLEQFQPIVRDPNFAVSYVANLLWQNPPPDDGDGRYSAGSQDFDLAIPPAGSEVGLAAGIENAPGSLESEVQEMLAENAANELAEAQSQNSLSLESPEPNNSLSREEPSGDFEANVQQLAGRLARLRLDPEFEQPIRCHGGNVIFPFSRLSSPVFGVQVVGFNYAASTESSDWRSNYEPELLQFIRELEVESENQSLINDLPSLPPPGLNVDPIDAVRSTSANRSHNYVDTGAGYDGDPVGWDRYKSGEISYAEFLYQLENDDDGYIEDDYLSDNSDSDYSDSDRYSPSGFSSQPTVRISDDFQFLASGASLNRHQDANSAPLARIPASAVWGEPLPGMPRRTESLSFTFSIGEFSASNCQSFEEFVDASLAQNHGLLSEISRALGSSAESGTTLQISENFIEPPAQNSRSNSEHTLQWHSVPLRSPQLARNEQQVRKTLRRSRSTLFTRVSKVSGTPSSPTTPTRSASLPALLDRNFQCRHVDDSNGNQPAVQEHRNGPAAVAAPIRSEIDNFVDDPLQSLAEASSLSKPCSKTFVVESHTRAECHPSDPSSPPARAATNSNSTIHVAAGDGDAIQQNFSSIPTGDRPVNSGRRKKSAKHSRKGSSKPKAGTFIFPAWQLPELNFCWFKTLLWFLSLLLICSCIGGASATDPMICSYESASQTWFIPEPRSCQAIELQRAELQELELQIYKSNVVRYISEGYHCSKSVEHITTYANFFGYDKQWSNTYESEIVSAEECQEMWRTRTCSGMPMVQKGIVWVTEKPVSYRYAGGWTEYGYLHFSGTHCMLTPAKIYKFHFKQNMHSTVGSVDHCRFSRGECLLRDHSHLVWRVNETESCEYVKLKRLVGQLMGNVWIADSENLALTFTDKRIITSPSRCPETPRELEQSDQGIVIQRLGTRKRPNKSFPMTGQNGAGTPPPAITQSEMSAKLQKRADSKIGPNFGINPALTSEDRLLILKQYGLVCKRRDEPGIVTAEFESGQLQYLLQKVRQTVKFAFMHTFQFVCKNTQQIAKFLKATILANPSIAFRELLNVSYISARTSGNLVQVYPCQRLAKDQYRVLAMPKDSCTEDIPIRIFLFGKFLNVYLDPKTNIIKTYSKPIRCDFLHVIPVALGGKYYTYHSKDGTLEIAEGIKPFALPSFENISIADLNDPLTIFRPLIAYNWSEFQTDVLTAPLQLSPERIYESLKAESAQYSSTSVNLDNLAHSVVERGLFNFIPSVGSAKQIWTLICLIWVTCQIIFTLFGTPNLFRKITAWLHCAVETFIGLIAVAFSRCCLATRGAATYYSTSARNIATRSSLNNQPQANSAGSQNNRPGDPVSIVTRSPDSNKAAPDSATISSSADLPHSCWHVTDSLYPSAKSSDRANNRVCTIACECVNSPKDDGKISVLFNGSHVRAMLDTGSCISAIDSQRYLHLCSLDFGPIEPSSEVFISASGDSLQSTGKINVEVMVASGHSCYLTIQLVRNLPYFAILGRDFLSLMPVMQYNGKTGDIKFGESICAANSDYQTSQNTRTKVNNGICMISPANVADNKPTFSFPTLHTLTQTIPSMTQNVANACHTICLLWSSVRECVCLLRDILKNTNAMVSLVSVDEFPLEIQQQWKELLGFPNEQGKRPVSSLPKGIALSAQSPQIMDRITTRRLRKSFLFLNGFRF